MQSAGHRERGLGLSKPVGERRDERERHAKLRLDTRRVDGDRLQRALAADAARRRRVEAPLEPRRIELRSVDVDRVRGKVVRKVRRVRPQALGQAEAECELLVVARRAHRHRDGTAADADLERFLDRDPVALAPATGQADDVDRRGGVRRSFHLG